MALLLTRSRTWFPCWTGTLPKLNKNMLVRVRGWFFCNTSTPRAILLFARQVHSYSFTWRRTTTNPQIDDFQIFWTLHYTYNSLYTQLGIIQPWSSKYQLWSLPLVVGLADVGPGDFRSWWKPNFGSPSVSSVEKRSWIKKGIWKIAWPKIILPSPAGFSAYSYRLVEISNWNIYFHSLWFCTDLNNTPLPDPFLDSIYVLGFLIIIAYATIASFFQGLDVFLWKTNDRRWTRSKITNTEKHHWWVWSYVYNQATGKSGGPATATAKAQLKIMVMLD